MTGRRRQSRAAISPSIAPVVEPSLDRVARASSPAAVVVPPRDDEFAAIERIPVFGELWGDACRVAFGVADALLMTALRGSDPTHHRRR